MTSLFWLGSCGDSSVSGVLGSDDNSLANVTTKYGIWLKDITEFDSVTVDVYVQNELEEHLVYGAENIDEDRKIRWDVVVDETKVVKIHSLVWNRGFLVGNQEESFISGQVPDIEDPDVYDQVWIPDSILFSGYAMDYSQNAGLVTIGVDYTGDGEWDIDGKENWYFEPSVREFTEGGIVTFAVQYDNEMTIMKDVIVRPYAACSGSFVDSRDGQEYACVSIGNQVWMAENLKYLPQVDNVSDDSEYETNGKYYYVYDYTPSGVGEEEEIDNAKATNNYDTYGVLYNWNAAMDFSISSTSNPSGVKGVCPDGWHLPSNDEWEELSYFVDLDYDGDANNNNEAPRLKATWGWDYPWNSDVNANGTDSYGFSALPGGYRGSSRFRDSGTSSLWWSATEDNNPSNAYFRGVKYDPTYIYWDSNYKEYGFSVRCVMNR
jgi:uncharacterized protein (TIGR02145 family)